MTLSASVVLLHAGGWDELLMIVVPFTLFLGFRYLIYRREQQSEDTPEPVDEERPV